MLVSKEYNTLLTYWEIILVTRLGIDIFLLLIKLILWPGSVNILVAV
jgi:hypothetical protein